MLRRINIRDISLYSCKYAKIRNINEYIFAEDKKQAVHDTFRIGITHGYFFINSLLRQEDKQWG